MPVLAPPRGCPCVPLSPQDACLGVPLVPLVITPGVFSLCPRHPHVLQHHCLYPLAWTPRVHLQGPRPLSPASRPLGASRPRTHPAAPPEWRARCSRDLPDPGIEPGSPALQADSLPTELPGKLQRVRKDCLFHSSEGLAESYPNAEHSTQDSRFAHLLYKLWQGRGWEWVRGGAELSYK